MASYITSISVLYPFISSTVLAEALDDDEDGSVDTTVYDALVGMVEAQFHSYVCRRYQIPLDTTDATILASAQFFCARLFEYHLFSRRRAVTPEIKARYDQTLLELERLRDGRLGFDDPPGAEASVVGGSINAEDDDRDYTAASMADWGGGGDRSA